MLYMIKMLVIVIYKPKMLYMVQENHEIKLIFNKLMMKDDKGIKSRTNYIRSCED